MISIQTIAIALVFSVTLLCSTGTVEATNTFFLPGDALFHFRLNGQLLETFEQEETLRFVYARPRQYGISMCGFAGFPMLEYHEMPQELRDNIVKLTRHLRATRHPAIIVREVDENGAMQAVEINPFHVFLYNESFDDYHLLGMKLNEHWNEHTMQLETFVPGSETPEHIQRLKARANPLQVEVPFELVRGKKPEEDSKQNGAGSFFGNEYVILGGPRIEEPVLVRGNRKFVLIPSQTKQRPRNGTTAKPTPDQSVVDVSKAKPGSLFYVVTAQEVVGYRSVKRKWVPFDPFE